MRTQAAANGSVGEEVSGVAKRSSRLSLTVSREMTIALEVLASKSNLGVATQAMVILRQGLDRTIQSDGVQIRLKQEQAFRTRDEWLADQSNETFVERALEAAGGGEEVEPA